MNTVSIQLEELTCPSCINKIETALNRLDGVSEAKVLFNSSKVKATYNEETINVDKLKKTIFNLGYKVIE